MKAVNLLPPDYAGAQHPTVASQLGQHAVVIAGVGTAVIAVAALGLAYSSASSTVSSKTKELATLKDKLAVAAQNATPAGQGVQARLTQINSTDATRVSWDGFMSRLARVLPEDVWLTSLSTANSLTSGAAASPTAASTPFTISGYTYSQKSVARVMRRLELLPWLNGIQLQSSQLTTVGPKSAFQFTITGGVDPLPAKEAS